MEKIQEENIESSQKNDLKYKNEGENNKEEINVAKPEEEKIEVPKPDVKEEEKIELPKPDVKEEENIEVPKPDVKEEKIEVPKPDVKEEEKIELPKSDVKEEEKIEDTKPDIQTKIKPIQKFEMKKEELCDFINMESIKKHELEIQTSEGGIDQTNKHSSSIMKIVGSFITKITKKMLSGQFNFSSMQRPSITSVPRSHVQILAREFCLILKACNKMLCEEDPVEKLKFLIAGLLGNVTYNIYRSEGKSPINPTLGETLTVN